MAYNLPSVSPNPKNKKQKKLLIPLNTKEGKIDKKYISGNNKKKPIARIDAKLRQNT
ncbi:MAG: hypothetical protein IPH42_07145 [Bacteroidetes bacterium]|nr:hypothetical protein [Bacteroidota bacterium]